MMAVRFYDLVVQVAIIRPGLIVGAMLHLFLRRSKIENPGHDFGKIFFYTLCNRQGRSAEAPPPVGRLGLTERPSRAFLARNSVRPAKFDRQSERRKLRISCCSEAERFPKLEMIVLASDPEL